MASTTSGLLPATATYTADSVSQVSAAVLESSTQELPVYPLGGGTATSYGLPATEAGCVVDLTGLNQLIDFPARDLTVTVQAGQTMAELAAHLATERLQLPVDVPHVDQATIGGVIATAWNGPRKFGCGGIRDFVIGIQGVSAEGRVFRAGGRVVKNVAGYDFCKLLTGSLGTLAIITEVTFKLRPIPACTRWLAASVPTLESAEQELEWLNYAGLNPVSIQLATPDIVADLPPWQPWLENRASADWLLLVAVEGTEPEVDYQQQQIGDRWSAQAFPIAPALNNEAATQFTSQLAGIPAEESSPVAIRAALLPSCVTRFCATARSIDPRCRLLADAGSGSVVMHFSDFPAEGLGRALAGQLHPVAAAAQGHVTMLRNESGGEMTHQCVWGAFDIPLDVMRKIKQTWDPHNLLNRGRFVY